MYERTRLVGRRRPGAAWTAGNLVAAAIRGIGSLFALILLTHILLVVFEANPTNGFAEFIRDWADWLSLGLKDLFTPESLKWRVTLNYGLAALLWLLLAGIAERIVRTVTRAG